MISHKKLRLLVTIPLLLMAAPAHSMLSLFKKPKSKPVQHIDPSLIVAALHDNTPLPPEIRKIILACCGINLTEIGTVSIEGFCPRDGYQGPHEDFFKIEHLQQEENGILMTVITPPRSPESTRAGILHTVQFSLDDQDLHVRRIRDHQFIGGKLPAAHKGRFLTRKSKKRVRNRPSAALSGDESLVAEWDPSQSSIVHISRFTPAFDRKICKRLGIDPTGN